MREDNTEIALYSLPTTPAELEQAFISDDYIDRLIESIRSKSKSVVGDLNTVKGRKVYISMAASVRSSKAAIDEAGKNLVAEMKKRPALVDASRRKIREALDELAVEIRQPVTAWEAEQERLKAEADMLAWHTEALEMNEAFDKAAAERFESDHEIALLLNEKFDRDAAEKAAEAERQRIAHEEELKRQAVEQARIDAEQQVQRERQQHQDALSEINSIQQQVIIAQSGRLGVRKGGTVQCIKDTLAETEAWPIDDRFGSLKGEAERAKQQAIEQIKQLLITAEIIEKQQEELATAERNKREAEAKEVARLAEEKRIADEAAARAANEAHRKAIGTLVVKSLMEHAGLTREQAISTLSAIKDNRIPHTSITY